MAIRKFDIMLKSLKVPIRDLNLIEGFGLEGLENNV